MTLPAGVARYLPDPEARASLAEIVEQLRGATVDEALRTYRILDEAWATGDAWEYDAFRAALGLSDRYYLLVVLCGRVDMVKPHRYGRAWLYDRCREVESDPDYHLDLWARDHYKSSIITQGGILQEVLRDPELSVGIFSHTKQIAKTFLAQLKREMEQNETLQHLYRDALWGNPRKEAPKWSEDEGLIVRRKTNPKEASIEAHGLVDGMPTSRHFALIVYDDVVTKESVSTPEQIKKVTESFELSDNLGQEGGRRWYIGTRYHLADTYKTIMDRGIVTVRKYPATDNGRTDGKPVFLTQEELTRKLKTQPTTFAAQMLQNPAAGPERVFDLKTLKGWEVRPRTLRVFILCDPAKGPGHKEVGAERDRTAIPVIGVDSARKMYLLDGYRHRMNMAQRWEALKNLHKKWTGMRGVTSVQVGYERYGMQTDLEYLERMMQIEKYTFAVDEVAWPRDGAGAKTDRVLRLLPDILAGRFLLPALCWHETHGTAMWDTGRGELDFIPCTETPQQRRAIEEGGPDLLAKPVKRLDENKAIYDLVRDFIDEATFFPYGLHDDLLDACSRVYDMEPVPPRQYRPEDLSPPVYADGV